MAYRWKRAARRRKPLGEPRPNSGAHSRSRSDEGNSSFGSSRNLLPSSSPPLSAPPALTEEETLWLCGITPHSAMSQWFQSIKGQLQRRLVKVTTGSRRHLPPFRRRHRSASARRNYHYASVLRRTQSRSPESVIIRPGGVASYTPLVIPPHVVRHCQPKGIEGRKLKVYRPSRHPRCSVKYCPSLLNSSRSESRGGVDSLYLPSTPSPRGPRGRKPSSVRLGKGEEKNITFPRKYRVVRSATGEERKWEDGKEARRMDDVEKNSSRGRSGSAKGSLRSKARNSKGRIDGSFFVSSDVLAWESADEDYRPENSWRPSSPSSVQISSLSSRQPPKTAGGKGSGKKKRVKIPIGNTTTRRKKVLGQVGQHNTHGPPRIIIPKHPFREEKGVDTTRPNKFGGMEVEHGGGGTKENGEGKIEANAERDGEREREEGSEALSGVEGIAAGASDDRDRQHWTRGSIEGVAHSVDVPPWWEASKRRATRHEEDANEQNSSYERGDDLMSEEERKRKGDSSGMKNEMGYGMKKHSIPSHQMPGRRPSTSEEGDYPPESENSSSRGKGGILSSRNKGREEETGKAEGQWGSPIVSSLPPSQPEDGSTGEVMRRKNEVRDTARDKVIHKGEGEKANEKDGSSTVDEVLRRLEVVSSEDLFTHSDFLQSLLSSGTRESSQASNNSTNHRTSSTSHRKKTSSSSHRLNEMLGKASTSPPSLFTRNQGKQGGGEAGSSFTHRGGAVRTSTRRNANRPPRIGDLNFAFRSRSTTRENNNEAHHPVRKPVGRQKDQDVDGSGEGEGGMGKNSNVSALVRSSSPFPSSSSVISPWYRGDRDKQRGRGGGGQGHVLAQHASTAITKGGSGVPRTRMERAKLHSMGRGGGALPSSSSSSPPSRLSALEEDIMFTKPIGDRKHSGAYEMERHEKNRLLSQRSSSVEALPPPPSSSTLRRPGSESLDAVNMEWQLRRLKYAIRTGNTMVGKERLLQQGRGGGVSRERGEGERDFRMDRQGGGSIFGRPKSVLERKRVKKKEKLQQGRYGRRENADIHQDSSQSLEDRKGRGEGGVREEWEMDHHSREVGQEGVAQNSPTVLPSVHSEDKKKGGLHTQVKVLSLGGAREQATQSKTLNNWRTFHQSSDNSRREGEREGERGGREGTERGFDDEKGSSDSQARTLPLLAPISSILPHIASLPPLSGTFGSSREFDGRRNSRRRRRRGSKRFDNHRDNSIMEDKWDKLPVLGSTRTFSGPTKRTPSRDSFHT